jgi:ABC-2 type transport system permease protein/lipopolysaccharide transport system permease protein
MPAVTGNEAALTGNGNEPIAAAGAAALDGHPPTASADDRAAEPRPEIWFKRSIGLRVALRDAWRGRALIVTLAERDLRVRYKQAVLGFAWAIFTPVILMLVFTFLFTKFIGLIPWTFFSNSINGGGMSLATNMQIVNKIYCPREVFPLGALAVGLFDAALSIGVLVVLFVIEGFLPHLETLYFPIFLPALFAFTLGLTLALAVLIVYLRDLRHVLPLLLQFALFATPVAYAVTVIADTREKLMLYSALNPLVPVIDGFRRTILLGLNPDWAPLGVGTASAFVYLAFGYWLFKRLEGGIADIA